jgi:hypothetical protein
MPRCKTKGCGNDCLGEEYPDHEEEGCMVDIEYCDECNIKQMQDGDADKIHERNEKHNENDVNDLIQLKIKQGLSVVSLN